MTVKKAIKLLDLWIEHREESIEKLNSEYIFNDFSITKTLVDCDQRIIDNLKLIKKELVPKCKHPKNMRDTCKGVVYCMNCNLDM